MINSEVRITFSGCKRADALISLLRWLKWVDTLIERAINIIPSVYGSEVTQDAFRGLHISPFEAQRLLDREPGASLFDALNQEV